MKHITFDLETLGNSSTAPIVQLAAVAFETTGEVTGCFDQRINLESSWSCFNADIGTIEWWISQSTEVQQKVFHKEGRVSLSEALNLFGIWLAEIPGKKKLWSHATFDPPILCNAYRKMKITMPFHYRDFMDIRTLNFLAQDQLDLKPRTDFGAPHDALADCHFQAHYIHKMLNGIKPK